MTYRLSRCSRPGYGPWVVTACLPNVELSGHPALSPPPQRLIAGKPGLSKHIVPGSRRLRLVSENTLLPTYVFFSWFRSIAVELGASAFESCQVWVEVSAQAKPSDSKSECTKPVCSSSLIPGQPQSNSDDALQLDLLHRRQANLDKQIEPLYFCLPPLRNSDLTVQSLPCDHKNRELQFFSNLSHKLKNKKKEATGVRLKGLPALQTENLPPTAQTRGVFWVKSRKKKRNFGQNRENLTSKSVKGSCKIAKL